MCTSFSRRRTAVARAAPVCALACALLAAACGDLLPPAAPVCLDGRWGICCSGPDRSRNLCTVLVLIHPGSARGLDIIAPTGWVVERGFMTDRATDCRPPPMAPQGHFITLASGSGTV